MTHVSSSGDSRSASNLSIQNPSLDCIVKDYCGITISELAKKKDSEYETRLLWTETKIAGPTALDKMLVEMLHLAYTRGGEF